MKKLHLIVAFIASISAFSFANAAEYKIDQTHTTIGFKVSHLGFSYVVGRFDDFEGNYNFDSASAEKSSVMVKIDTTSINTNNSARDKHLKSSDFLNAGKFPEATFNSTAFKVNNENTAVMTGDFTLNGVTKSVDIEVAKIGEGKDPWGGYRSGFSGSFSFTMDEFDFEQNYGEVMIDIVVEGIKK